jgi:hypothetical protein
VPLAEHGLLDELGVDGEEGAPQYRLQPLSVAAAIAG